MQLGNKVVSVVVPAETKSFRYDQMLVTEEVVFVRHFFLTTKKQVSLQVNFSGVTRLCRCRKNTCNVMIRVSS